MTGRHGYDARPERQNEYFIPGDGISREVIQADICRYLGNDALGRPGFFIRAYRNLTSEMIADLKADSARWEADVLRRQDQGYPRAPYASSAEVRQQGPSPPPSFSSAPPVQPYVDPYGQPQYSAPQSTPYPAQQAYPPPFGPGQPPYPQQAPYSAPSQPPVSADIMHPTYTYTSNTGYPYENGRSNAPRYTGPGYETETDYSPVTTGIAYPATTAPDPRIGVDPRYTPEYDRNRPQPAREGPAPRRPR